MQPSTSAWPRASPSQVLCPNLTVSTSSPGPCAKPSTSSCPAPTRASANHSVSDARKVLLRLHELGFALGGPAEGLSGLVFQVGAGSAAGEVHVLSPIHAAHVAIAIGGEVL